MENAFLADALRRLTVDYQHQFIESDPIGVVRRFRDPQDREVAGLLAASLSLGRADIICAKAGEVMDRLDGAPHRILLEESRPSLAKRLKGFKHRFFDEHDLLDLCLNVRTVLRREGALAGAWDRSLPFEESVDRFVSRFALSSHRRRSATIPFLAGPSSGSSCKRTMMFLRWMVRPDDGVDLGLWSAPARRDLVIPMDVHIFRISRLIGLIRGSTPNWKAAVRLTQALRMIDPEDPVRFDFALSRLGIVEGCRGRRVETICPQCALESICREGAKRSRVA